MRYKYLKHIIIPIIVFLIIAAGLFSFILFSNSLPLTPTGKSILITGITCLLCISVIVLVFSIFSLFNKERFYRKEEFIKKAGMFEDFYELLYEYAYEKSYSSEMIKSIKKQFSLLSMYLSDRAIKLFNDYFIQTQDFTIDTSLDKKELKQKRVSFEQCVVALREELGLDIVNKKTIEQVARTKRIFEGLELEWFDWNKSKVWFLEMCRDHGNAAMEYMKKHNLIFIGGGPKGHNANIIKQIKKDDIILGHKYDEGYVAIGIVTVDTKTIIWPKDNPLMYNDGEIRLPVRWLLFVNVGVNAGYTPDGLISRVRSTHKALQIFEAMYKRGTEAGTEFSDKEVREIIESLKSRTRLIKPRIDRKV